MGIFDFLKKRKKPEIPKVSIPLDERTQWSEEKKRRMKEKSLRKPLNDVVLDVQKGVIDIKDVIRHIEERVKEKKNG
jgi:hypothetical protein